MFYPVLEIQPFAALKVLRVKGRRKKEIEKERKGESEREKKEKLENERKKS